ncbi:MAG: peptidoglycan editing factor PgeF [bacterium]
MKIIRSNIFQRFPEIIFGFSSKIGFDRKAPFFFNMSFTVGDDLDIVKKNRSAFFTELGLSYQTVVYQKQIHGEDIKIVTRPGLAGESDAMITSIHELGLAISSADCPAIFIYDKHQKVIGAVHSGWRSTVKKILEKTLHKMSVEFESKPENLFVYLSPHISQKNYEVDESVASQFDERYSIPIGDKYLLDLGNANLDMLLSFGIPISQIEYPGLCSFENSELFHSYRRDGQQSGRALGVIAMRNI